MWRAYAFGFFSAAAAVLVVAVVWFGTQTREEPGLLWGNRVYSSKQDFERYLKTKSLSYKTWVARHPGGAPWEPDQITIGAVTLRASTETREAWVVRLPLAALALIMSVAGTLLLLRALRRVTPRVATRPIAFVTAACTVLLITVIWFGTVT